MESPRHKFDIFTSTTKLTKETFKDLVRLYGYSPTEEQLNVSIPTTYEEFESLLARFDKPYTKDTLYKQLCSFNNSGIISKEELVKMLKTGDRLTDEEIEDLFKIITVSNGQVNVKEMLDVLFSED